MLLNKEYQRVHAGAQQTLTMQETSKVLGSANLIVIIVCDNFVILLQEEAFSINVSFQFVNRHPTKPVMFMEH